ncbi:septum formation inhibitor Maf [Winogradskyella sp. PE311]|uniref:septum formation inhibitor Maf n=1 Tax=Winogradskyella sp. PE311 TaxID=3366943 RepID=UPI003980398E
MRKSIKNMTCLFIVMVSLTLLNSCKKNKQEPSENLALSEPKTEKEVIESKSILSKEFNDYWYAGEAEITSYKLEQARYGEIRNGNAVLVFVTEDFLPNKQVKADNYSKKNTPILKLNATKNFNTGIYPYSIMQSTFYPVVNNKHALKISASVQEWCGHVYTQLNNRDDFEVMSHSYFESEGDQTFNVKKTWTENEIWTKLRINPSSLPIGEIEIIPSLEFTRLKHIDIKSYQATTALKDGIYTITYAALNRTLKINFNQEFPFDILGWEETSISGYGPNSKTLTTKATKLESIKSAYWNKNNNANEVLREKLRLQ